ncbi:MAG: sodium:proton antiporter [Bacteroidetes bacterium 4572_77]|nr:MAG: sodium:proton antiporter [Bacteroidetes bacterium 4572_77]
MYNSFIILLALSTLLTIINRKYLKLPATIGILILGIFISIGFMILKDFNSVLYTKGPHILKSINFHDFLMNIILGFLLFAGALNINFTSLKKEKASVFLFAVFGTLISTFVVGFSIHYFFKLLSVDIPLLYSLLFGSLISPTDPIAVLAIFKNYKINKSLSIKIEGESLFNDGIGIVFFVSILSIIQSGQGNFEISQVVVLFLREAVGGIVFGLGIGGFGILLLKQLKNDPKTAVMTTLVMVMGGWLLANYLQVSAALAMVSAGISFAYWLHAWANESTKNMIYTFWEILDEIFNSMLFVLMGLAIILIDPKVINISTAIATIFIVLMARVISVSIPYSLIRNKNPEKRLDKIKVISILSWSGLRGALAFALALSVSSLPYGHHIVFLTYCVAVFSIIVQGLTIGKMVEKFGF